MGLREIKESRFLEADVDYTSKYLEEVQIIASKIEKNQVREVISILKNIREKQGRLFFIGVGGGAANASHAVNDFRKICGIEAYAPTDNISELSARINDEGWDGIFVSWLKQSKLGPRDGLFILSVGGGSREKNISVNIVKAIDYATERRAKIVGIVGRDGGYTAKKADACVIIPPLNAETITPHAEAFQAVVWHLMVSHPAMKTCEMKWESVK
jgi:D-sedoheptulose 7-phosphate isomerase